MGIPELDRQTIDFFIRRPHGDAVANYVQELSQKRIAEGGNRGQVSLDCDWTTHPGSSISFSLLRDIPDNQKNLQIAIGKREPEIRQIGNVTSWKHAIEGAQQFENNIVVLAVEEGLYNTEVIFVTSQQFTTISSNPLFA